MAQRQQQSVATAVTEDSDEVQLCSDNFDAVSFVREHLDGVKNGDEMKKLRELRSKLSVANVASSESIREGVFQNYQQFIGASKEISHLEREVYELSSLLTDQRALIESLMQMCGEDRSSVCTASSLHTTSATTNSITILMQKMDGIAFSVVFAIRMRLLGVKSDYWGLDEEMKTFKYESLLNNLSDSNRLFLFGEVTQLDSDNKRPLHPVLLVLLSDRLLIGHPSTGKYRFKLESSHSLNALAAVNVKDRDGGEKSDSAFKLLIFPEQRVYCCESSRMKKDWLEGIENAKREMLQENFLVRQATIRGKRRNVELSLSTTGKGGRDDLEPLQEGKTPDESAWLAELPAELDDCMAHRDLEQAVEMIMEWKSCSTSDSAIDAQLSLREAHIVQILSDEVCRPGALHGGPRAVRKAINLLTSLGRGAQAVDLYLKRRSAALRQSAREITVSEEPLSYVRQLSQQFINAMCDVANEFSTQPEYFALILRWFSEELSLMLSLIQRHVIEVAPTMAVLAHTWRILMTQFERLRLAGADLTFQVHRLLAPSLRTALKSNFDNIIESVKLRISEERWRPYNMENESNVNRFLEEMADMGLCIDWAVSSADRSSINISQNACHFSRVAHSLCRDLAVLRSSHLREITDGYVTKLWDEYLQHLSNFQESTVQQYTLTFIISQLLPLCDVVYDSSSPDLLSRLLETKYPKLLRYRDDNEDDVGLETKSDFSYGEVAEI